MYMRPPPAPPACDAGLLEQRIENDPAGRVNPYGLGRIRALAQQLSKATTTIDFRVK